MPGHGLGTRSQTESECLKQKLKLELLRGSRPKLESLPVSVVVHEHLVRAGCMFFGTTTRRTLTRLHRRQKLSVLGDMLQQRGPPKLCDKVPRTAAQRCDYSLRNSSSPAIPLCRIFHRQNSFLPASLALFNSLPASVPSCSSKPAFLSALDKYFLPDKFNFGFS